MSDSIGRHREAVERLAQAVLETAGHTSPSLRRAVEERAAALGGRTTACSSETVPAAVDPFVTAVALHAYKVTDSGIDALKETGLSEDGVFEIILSAALGSAVGRLERGLVALREANRETQSS